MEQRTQLRSDCGRLDLGRAVFADSMRSIAVRAGFGYDPTASAFCPVTGLIGALDGLPIERA